MNCTKIPAPTDLDFGAFRCAALMIAESGPVAARQKMARRAESSPGSFAHAFDHWTASWLDALDRGTSTYCIIWRSGGTRNWRWHRSLPMPRVVADEAYAATRLAGHVAFLEPFAESATIGLPDTYEAGNFERVMALYACRERCKGAVS